MIASVTGITGTQIKVARKLLGWSIATLAKKAGRPYGLIAKAESSTLRPQYRDVTVAAIQGALETAGIEFLTDG
jgi:predicted transcriptional regulator